MPNSLRARLRSLRYKKIISDKDYYRLCKALDLEKEIEDIKTEIQKEIDVAKDTNTENAKVQVIILMWALEKLLLL